jgi:hypothetical protein
MMSGQEAICGCLVSSINDITLQAILELELVPLVSIRPTWKSFKVVGTIDFSKVASLIDTMAYGNIK